MKRNLVLAALMLFVASMMMTGCNKEEGKYFRLSIQQYSNTDKTSYYAAGSNTLWTAGDQIYINGTDANHTATVVENDGVYTAGLASEYYDASDYYSFYAGRATNVSYDATAHTYTYTMPSTFAYSTTELLAPMVGHCSSTSPTIYFRNVCALLKLTFVYAPQTVTITSAGTDLSGEFSAIYDGSTTTITPSASNTNCTTLVVDNSTAQAVTLYIPIPAGQHQLHIEASGVDKRMTSAQNVQAGYFYAITCSAPTFSVGESTSVYFSPANLQYTNGGTWSFAANSYDILGETANEAISGDDYTSIDLFGWGTSGWNYNGSQYTEYYNPDDFQFASTTSTNYSGGYNGYGPVYINNSRYEYQPLTGDYANGDWGVYNTITNGGTGWRTLTGATSTSDHGEWGYLLNTRSASTVNGVSNARYAKIGVTVGSNTVYGLLIFPDSFTWPTGVTLPTTTSINCGSTSSQAWSSYPTYSTDDLTLIEEAGAAFLPAAGYRTTESASASAPTYYGDGNGYYWSSSNGFYGDGSSRDNGYASYLYFGTTAATSSSWSQSTVSVRCIDRYRGFCVRLVKDATSTSSSK